MGLTSRKKAETLEKLHYFFNHTDEYSAEPGRSLEFSEQVKSDIAEIMFLTGVVVAPMQETQVAINRNTLQNFLIMTIKQFSDRRRKMRLLILIPFIWKPFLSYIIKVHSNYLVLQVHICAVRPHLPIIVYSSTVT